MKTLILSLLLLPLAAHAFNDFECEFASEENTQVLIEVERNQLSSSKRVVVTESYTEEETQNQFTYFTFARYNPNMRNIEFFGGGLNFEIDLWPDNRPRFGRRYRANFGSFDISEGQMFFDIWCRYTGF